MSRISRLLVLCLFVSLPAVASDRHIVLFSNGTPADFAANVAALGGRVESSHPLLAVVSGLTGDGAASLGSMKGVAEVQPDAEITLDPVELAPEAEPDFGVASPSNPTTASFYSRQWHHRAIGANVAWAAGRLGSSNVTVAILDTGIDRRANPHPDLAGRVDYARGMRFQLDDPSCVPPTFVYGSTDDVHFHGTHVGSTVSSNAIAAAGVTSKVTLVPVKVLGLRRASTDGSGAGACTGGSGSLSAVLNGVLHAADIDADVANMSLGGGFSKAGNGRFVGLINKVFNYAHRKGTLIVVSAGNSAIDMDANGNALVTYCDSPNTVCVSALGPTKATTGLVFENVDSFAGYSNYGSSVNVSAPGGTGSGIAANQRQRGYVTAACSRAAFAAGLSICQTGTFVLGSNGTSMASPHVSGLAALIVENVGKDRPSLVKAILQQSADDLGPVGTDPFYGKGRINVPRALGLQ